MTKLLNTTLIIVCTLTNMKRKTAIVHSAAILQIWQVIHNCIIKGWEAVSIEQIYFDMFQTNQITLHLSTISIYLIQTLFMIY